MRTKKNIFLIISFELILTCTIFSQSGWIKIPFDHPIKYSNKLLVDVQFIDSLNGWTLGSGGIYNTEDGGQTWELKYHPKYFHATPHNRGIAFTRKDTCYFVYNNYFYYTYNNGYVWDSTVISYESRYSHSAYFINDSIGWGLGQETINQKRHLTIYKTTDRGGTWEKIFYEPIENYYYEKFYSIIFPSEGKGFATGMWGNIYQTSDSGKTWIKNKINDGSLFSVFFIDTSIGWVVGYDGAILATTNGGLNWKQQYSSVKSTLNDVFFTNKNHGIAVGNSGTIIYTNNGGENWINISRNTYLDLYTIDFIDDSIGWIVGGKGWDSSVVYKTYSGGIVSIKNEKLIVENNFILFQNYPNPYNPSTTIKYSIPNATSGFSLSNVTLKVYNILGREVTTLVNQKQKPGNYTVEFNANNLPSGVYFYRLTAGSFIETKKMIFLR